MEQPVVLSKARLVIVVALAGELAACSSSSSSSFGDAVNPINWYRDIMGLSADDELGTGENDQNLQEGAKEPYPNLASVPNPPDTALSSADQQKLVDSLVADRNNAKYSNERLIAGTSGTTATPPAPRAATPSTSPTASADTPAPPPTQAAPATPAAPPTASSSPQATSSAPPTRPGQPPKRGSEPPPAESSLTSPTVSNVPQGEAATPAPPLPQIPPPQAERLASAVPRATAPPKLKPPGSGATETTAPSAAPRGAAVSYHAADVRFAPGSALLGDKLGDTIAEIVKLHNENGGTIRIVGHGESGGANAAVAGLNLALDRAQAVAVALTNSGVAAKEISVEAAPVAARGGSDIPRAEVYLEN